MKPLQSVQYRLKLAEGFLQEAQQDLNINRWRSCVDNAQLTVENALKALIALWAPVPRTHRPGANLAEMLNQRQIPEHFKIEIGALIAKAGELDPAIHIQTDYGDEMSGLTPWDLFDEEDAREAYAIAREVFSLARRIVEEVAM
jgi:HEPN domain-containing protein